jgi:hypothetical protein
VPELRALAGRGVYVGVGPDQNFSDIAHLRPSLAIVIDIRRENLLLHLLSVFSQAHTRDDRPVSPAVHQRFSPTGR